MAAKGFTLSVQAVYPEEDAEYSVSEGEPREVGFSLGLSYDDGLVVVRHRALELAPADTLIQDLLSALQETPEWGFDDTDTFQRGWGELRHGFISALRERMVELRRLEAMLRTPGEGAPEEAEDDV